MPMEMEMEMLNGARAGDEAGDGARNGQRPLEFSFWQHFGGSSLGQKSTTNG